MKEKTTSGLAVIVQCRLSSSRLPGKALKKLGGSPVLAWTLCAMRNVRAQRYVVAVDFDSLSELEPIAKECGWEIFAGPLDDVLARYCMVIRETCCSTVLRATADNPFLFYEAAQALCDEFQKQQRAARCDYMTWTGLPHGSGVEVFRAESLLRAESLASDAYEHEHVGPALYNHTTEFTSIFMKAPARFYFPELRTTIDTPADYRRAVSVVNKLSGGIAPAQPYTTEQIVSAVCDPAVSDTVLFVPSVKKGRGTGHLRRCLSAARDSGAFVYIPPEPELAEADAVVREYMDAGLGVHQLVRLLPEPGEYALIAADCFALEREEALRFRKAAQLLAIDDGSENGRCCDYLLDILPSADAARVPNLREPAFIDTPKNRKPAAARGTRKLEKILVCLGGEDPAALTAPAAAFFASEERDVTAVLPHSADFVPPSGKNIAWIPPVKNLKESLASYDVVVTHFGLTAFEAAAAGCAVVLLPTTKLHERLAKAHGFFCLDVRQKPSLSADAVLRGAETLYPPLYDGAPAESRPLGLFVKELSHGRRLLCPICRKDADGLPDEIVMRTARRTFRRCCSCGITYISWTADRMPAEYGASYFSESYKKQYGRTYLEDFDSIRKAGVRRMGEIRAALRLREASRPSILDVGCAYGPFLAAADGCGWQAFGTDISEDAVEYVRKMLLFPAVCARFPEFDAAAEFGVNEFSAVSMWYVIEHFSDLQPVLGAVSKLLKIGGVFAFSTPSCAGISAKSDAASFFEKSPADHFTVWEPSVVAPIVSRFGFSVVKIVSTGHHAERFPAVRKQGWKPSSPMFKLFDSISRMRRLGDTFEVYCRKIR